jgi:hypothetical protein
MENRFNVIDAMVLVAATAAGLAAGRDASVRWADGNRERVMLYALAMAVMWTFAIFLLGLTRHRTELRGMACRPGFSAVVAVMVERVINSLESIAQEVTQNPIFRVAPDSLTEWSWFLFHETFWHGTIDFGPAGAVSASWLVMAMAGCWHAEKSWIDRIGRTLGCFWILVTVVNRVGFWLFGYGGN